MKTRQRGSIGRWREAAVLCVVLSGCVSNRGTLQGNFPIAVAPAPEAAYQVHCPDVLAIAVQGPGSWKGRRRIGADGRLDLGDAGRPRVEGLTVAAIGPLVAQTLNVPPSQVELAVAEFNSRRIYLHGEVQGSEQAVPYRGPESVVELLQRVGGLSMAAAPRDIQVVRDNVADGGPPQVFRVNLEAISAKNDQRTNVQLQPFDQVYVGQSRRSCWTQALPPLLRPFGETLCGLRRPSPAPRFETAPMPRPLGPTSAPPETLPLPTPLPLRLAAP